MRIFKRTFSPNSFPLIIKENQKQFEHHISFDTNPSAFQSNETPLSSNTNNSNSNCPVNPYKVQQQKRDNGFHKTDEDNNFDCPEDLHFYYVNTLQKGKNMNVNFD